MLLKKRLSWQKGPADLVIDANNNHLGYLFTHRLFGRIIHHQKRQVRCLKLTVRYLLLSLNLTLLKEFHLLVGNLLAISPDKKTIYLEANGVMAIDYNATSLPTTRLIDGTSAYGLSVDPDNGNIWVIANNTATVYDNDGQFSYDLSRWNLRQRSCILRLI